MSDFDSPDPGPATETPFAPTTEDFTDDLIDAADVPDVLDDLPGEILASGIDDPDLDGMVSPNGDGTAPKKRRRRGSRGGRGRKKPGTGRRRVAASAASTATAPTVPKATTRTTTRTQSGGELDRRGRRPRSHRRRPRGPGARRRGPARARVADTRAGTQRRPELVRPRIGDSRPSAANARPGASVVADGTRTDAGTERSAGTDGDGEEPKKRRRRRGGRGRSKSGGTGTGSGTGNGAGDRSRAVRAGGEEAHGRRSVRRRGRPVDRRRRRRHGAARLARRCDAARGARGTRRKGRPAGRYLMVVHQRADEVAHIAVLEGRTARRALRRDADRRHALDRRQHLPRPRSERAARHGGRVHRHRHAQERRALPRRRRVRRLRRRGRRAAAHRAGAAQRAVDHRAGHEEPDRAQGRAPHAGGQPRGPLRRDGARRSRETYGISKRLPDDERKRLRRVLDRSVRPMPG